MDIGGVACIFRDTAGIRISSNDLIELEGIKRARLVFTSVEFYVLIFL
jgi:tRNA U34 5-carboxymethylaminomethyl modifying GTPase MnmE/TrmE